MYIRRTILIIFLLFLQSITTAQEKGNCLSTLSGTVLNADSFKPLPGVKVSIPKIGKFAFTDSNGYYEIKEICSGQYNVTCAYGTFETEELMLTIDSNLVRNFTLYQKVYKIDSIDITAEKEEETTQPKR